jgi:hypothetical protein
MAKALRPLRQVLDRIEIRGHEHLATPAWAGTALADTPFFDHSTLIHQVTLTRKPDDDSGSPGAGDVTIRS